MASHRYQVVFFDVGRTLIWAEPRADEIWVRALEANGYSLTPKEIVRKSGVRGPEVNRTDIIRALNETQEQFGSTFPPAEEEEAYFRHYDKALLHRLGIPANDAILEALQRGFDGIVTHVYEDVVSTLEGLRDEAYRLGIISNATHKLPAGLKKSGLAPFFESVTYSQAVGAEKPDPTIFRAALAAMNVRPSDAVHVGDNLEADIQGAKEVGLTPMLIDRERNHRLSDVIVLRSLGEIMGHLEG